MTSISDSRPPPARRVACLVVGRDEDALAVAEALRWREALGARLVVLYLLPAPVCVVSPEGGVWCEDPIAVQGAAADWLKAHAAALGVDEQVLLPGIAGASVGDWIGRRQPLLLVAVRRRGRLARLLGGDAAAHLPRHPQCAVQVVSEPPAVTPAQAQTDDPPPGRRRAPRLTWRLPGRPRETRRLTSS
jgi:hypothetical protein